MIRCLLPATSSTVRVLRAVFFAAGFAGLIGQVVWQRALTLVVGVGPVATAIVVSLCLAGLGCGALAGAALSARTRRRVDWFALSMAAVAVLGAASVPAFRAFDGTARAWVVLVSTLGAATLLTGAGLPLLVAATTRRSPALLSHVSRLYLVNTLGAAAGAMTTGFALIPLLGLDGAIYLAAALNLALAPIVWLVRIDRGPEFERRGDWNASAGAFTPAIAFALAWGAGFVAIGLEIVWFRLIGLLVKDTPFAFATVLAIYLAALAGGAWLVEPFLRRHSWWSARDLYLLLLALTGASVMAIIAGLYRLSAGGPLRQLVAWSFEWEVHPSIEALRRGAGMSGLWVAFDVLWWPLLLLTVPTMLTGAAFPLVASLACRRRGGEGAAVGTAMFFAVLGNVAGGLTTGLVLLPAVGTERTLFLLGGAALLSALCVQRVGTRPVAPSVRALLVASVAAAAWIAWPTPGALYARLHTPPFEASAAEFEEGRDAVVLTYAGAGRLRNFINGQGHGYRPGPLFAAEALDALSSARRPRRVLVVGIGAGTGIETALLDERVEEVTVVELCESVVANLRKFAEIRAILDDRRVRVVVADGRRFLQQTASRFDVILMDPLRTSTAHSNNVHSRQFFALARQHLADGGVLMVGGLDGGPVVPATLLTAFEHVRSRPYFCVASAEPVVRDDELFDRLLARLPRAMAGDVSAFVAEALDGEALRQAVAGVPVNDDWRPVSEYDLQPRRW